MSSITEKRWYLVQCKPKQDLRALENLRRQGYECLLPLHKIERLRKGKWNILEEPLFPGYLFIELDSLLDNWMPIRSTRGVSQIVRFGAEPASVPEKIIWKLKQESTTPKKELKPGDKIIIKLAETTGFEAVFLAQTGSERVLILLNFLNREIKLRTRTKGCFLAPEHVELN
ncbi:transcription/translation regulatory transformer protein RfaH [Pseudomonas nicosulfuronedens]|uniref:transcription/translation regulatory transformer protein RfaH n=1 Tax=Pseudomonas nicosulfuronedens TaxID=2571105 RepID=UPI002447A3F0|nr:transcription/translation regulatory transformer protein RfaH [Pseudomonas nicosulfuronedens]MDH1007223.1 transcription/translation regulatory transformer protein RfaH [Pseudomonas nicosulfuronedens]MDH1982068.1 transcription/translation regulatory transformer protein RfaH [Pseudomonas nicosulfuronedens]MDH2026318.1 transcription/translation regulatory transformer protein RfaH [Pseudomonas nicosulfuronedens]